MNTDNVRWKDSTQQTNNINPDPLNSEQDRYRKENTNRITQDPKKSS